MAVQIGPKIGIEGEKEYRQEIQQIIQQTKTLQSSMDATASSWTANTSQMTKNKAVAQNLVQQISQLERKLELQNEMLEESATKFGENDAKTQKWQQAVNETTASLNRMQAELKQLNGAADLSNFSTKMADIGTKMQNIGDSIAGVGQKLTTSLTLPIAAISAAAVKMGSDLTESANKVDVVFGQMSASVKDFASTSLDMYAISEGKALEMAGDYGAMATSMGISQQEAAKLATEMVGLAGDMASFHNKNIEIAQNSLKGVFTGETESLKQFGIAMTQVELEKFAEDQGKVYNQMSQAEKVMTRYQYVLESQKAALGDAGRTMGEFAGSTRKFQGALQEAGAALGEALIPMIRPMIQILTTLLQAFAQLPGPVQKFIAAILLIVAAIGPVILIVGLFVSALGSIITQGPLVVSAISKITAAFVGMEASMLPMLGYAALIVAALAAIAYVSYQVADNWDAISASANELGLHLKKVYDDIMTANGKLVNIFTSFVDEIIDTFRKLPKKIMDAMKEAVENIKRAFDNMIKNAKQSGKDFIQGFIDGIKEKISKVVDAVKDIANTIKDYLGFSCPDKGPLSEYEKWMPDFMDGLAKGINNNKRVVVKAMDNLAKSMVLPLDANASMNVALAGGGSMDGSTSGFGGTTMNVYVDHISELNDLIRIQNQAQQRYRMGAR